MAQAAQAPLHAGLGAGRAVQGLRLGPAGYGPSSSSESRAQAGLAALLTSLNPRCGQEASSPLQDRVNRHSGAGLCSLSSLASSRSVPLLFRAGRCWVHLMTNLFPCLLGAVVGGAQDHTDRGVRMDPASLRVLLLWGGYTLLFLASSKSRQSSPRILTPGVSLSRLQGSHGRLLTRH